MNNQDKNGGRAPVSPSGHKAGAGAKDGSPGADVAPGPSAFVRAAHPVRPAPAARTDLTRGWPAVRPAATQAAAPSARRSSPGAGAAARPRLSEAFDGRSWPRLLQRRPDGPVDLGRIRWRALDRAEPQAISLTYWFVVPAQVRTAGPGVPVPLRGRGRPLVPAPVVLRVVGRRRPDGEQPPQYLDVPLDGSRQQFDEEYRLDVPLATDEIAAWTITARNLAAGLWDLTATASHAGAGPVAGRPAQVRTAVSGRTLFAALADNIAPGARIGAWPLLVTAGAVAGLWSQHLLSARFGLPAGLLTLLSVLACLVGLVGAKSYYLLTHLRQTRGVLTTGMSVQGFVIGVLATLGTTVPAWGLPVGAVLDVSIPALLTGMAIGRLGCLLGGCCVGRPTGSRLGVWSSDRTLGARRIPVQLMESAAAAVLAATTFVVLAATGPRAGLVFVAGLSAYVLARQMLFPLRALDRATRYGRSLMMWISGVAALASAVALAIGR